MNRMKIYFKLAENIDNAENELLWAKTHDNQTFILDNIPFHVYGISLNDEFSVKDVDGSLYFDKILRKSGHSTYRILQLHNNPKDKFQDYWSPIEKLGASYESKVDGDRSLYAVDIPLHVDIKSMYELMKKGEADGIWHFEEADHNS